MSAFDIRTRDPATRARTGTLNLAHGEVRTPAFVPLATKAVVKTLEVREAAELGFDMVLGNTFHLFLDAGPRADRALGGLHRFMRWDRPVITDSGGFQVFSMGHGTVADEIKGRAAQAAAAGERSGAILKIEEQGVTFRSYLDGSTQFMGPETSMEVQAALGSDIALVFDECTPFHGDRDYTARSTERTHRWLDRCLAWHAEHGPPARSSTGSSRAAWRRTCGAPRRRRSRRGRSAGSRSAARSARTRTQMFEVVEWAVEELDEDAPAPPARHRRGRRPGARRRARDGHVRLRDADPHRPPRHGRGPGPGASAGASTSPRAATATADEPVLEGCPCPACAHGYSRAYLHYLLKAQEQTAQRLLTIHNLAYLQHLMAALRDAIDAGRLAEAAAAVRAGAAPWELA